MLIAENCAFKKQITREYVDILCTYIQIYMIIGLFKIAIIYYYNVT